MQTFVLGLRTFFLDLIGGILYFPVWWYTRGLFLIVKGALAWISGYAKSLALSVWVKNLFVPMYGMYDWQSRIISFFMRLAQIIFRMIGVLFLSVAMGIALLVYVLILPASVVALVYQIIGLYG